VTKADKLLAMMRKDDLRHPLLLVTKYINPQLADELKQNGTEFVDAVGNTFINQPPLYVFIKGNKPGIVIKAPPPKRTFKPAGLKVIYGFSLQSWPGEQDISRDCCRNGRCTRDR